MNNLVLRLYLGLVPGLVTHSIWLGICVGVVISAARDQRS